MSVLVPILLAFLAASPSTLAPPDAPLPAERVVYITTGTPHTLSVSGVSGTVTTRMPGNDAILLALELDEDSDDPCDLDLGWWRSSSNTSLSQGEFQTHLRLCGEQFSTNGLVGVGLSGGGSVASATHTSGDMFYAAHGIQTCLNRAGNKVKGIRLFGSTINQDGSGEVRRDPALKRDFERTNCKTWQTARKCPPGEVIVGLDLHHQYDDIKGIAPKCATVSVRTVNGGARSN